MSAPLTTATSPELRRELGLFSAITLVSGVMIGSGIFIVPADIARQVGRPDLLIAVWFFVGLITLLGAHSYGKLAAAFPHAGGQYIFLKQAWGELPAFLYGWALFFVIQTGFLAAVAVAFAKYLGVLWPAISSQNVLLPLGPAMGITTQQGVAIGVILTLTLYNSRGVKAGALLQNVFTTLKVVALMGLIAAGFWGASQGIANLPAVGVSHEVLPTPTPIPFLSAFAVATVGALFSADAWNNVTFVAEEVQEPQKNLPKALLLGVSIVLILYVLANVAYMGLLTFDQIQHAAEDRVATAAISRLWGPVGAAVMAGVILISTFGCLNGMTLAGARAFYAMAKDGLFFKAFATIHPRFQTPVISLWGQGLFAALLTLTGSYSQLLDYIIFTTLLFYVMTVAGLFRLARRYPEAIPMRGPWAAWPPLMYLAMVIYIAINLAWYKPEYTLPGLGIVSAGIPIYFLWKALHRHAAAHESAG